MAWIELHQTVHRHPKVFEAADRLGLKPTYLVGHLTALWHWALDFAPGGALPVSIRHIERAADWDGDEGRFVRILVEVGLIDETPAGLVIHDWDDYAGRIEDRRAVDRERKRREREATRAAASAAKASIGRPVDVTRTSGGHPKDVTRTSGATVPNRTVPNRTSSDLQSEHEANDAPAVLGALAASPTGAHCAEAAEQPEHDVDDGADGKKPPRPAADPPGFAAAWDAYGHKKDRKQAVEQWRRLKPDEALQGAILAAIPLLHATDTWRKAMRKSFFRWLRDRNWEDDYPPAAPPAGSRSDVIEIDVWEAERARTRAQEEQRARAQ